MRFGWAVESYRSGKCGGPDNEDCLREALRLYKAETDAIIAEILSTRSTDDTIIRTLTSHFCDVNIYKDEGHFEGVHPTGWPLTSTSSRLPPSTIFLSRGYIGRSTAQTVMRILKTRAMPHPMDTTPTRWDLT